MDLMQLHADLGSDTPSKSAAYNTSSEEVVPGRFIAHHKGEVLWHIVQQNMQWRCSFEIGFSV